MMKVGFVIGHHLKNLHSMALFLLGPGRIGSPHLLCRMNSLRALPWQTLDKQHYPPKEHFSKMDGYSNKDHLACGSQEHGGKRLFEEYARLETTGNDPVPPDQFTVRTNSGVARGVHADSADRSR